MSFNKQIEYRYTAGTIVANEDTAVKQNIWSSYPYGVYILMEVKQWIKQVKCYEG